MLITAPSLKTLNLAGIVGHISVNSDLMGVLKVVLPEEKQSLNI
jgi:hypothetical protein